MKYNYLYVFTGNFFVAYPKLRALINNELFKSSYIFSVQIIEDGMIRQF